MTITQNASQVQLAAFGRSVGANVVEHFPGPFGPRVVEFAARTAAKKLRAKGYSAVQANVAALAASNFVKGTA